MRTKVIIVPGTWDVAPGMLSGVVKRLDKARFEPHYIHYPKAFGFPVSYEESKSVAIKRIRQAWEENPRQPVILLGYSQGADAAGDFAKTVQHDPRLKAVALVADPKRPRGVQIGSKKLAGHGIAGERPIHHPNHWQVAVPGDVVCDAAEGSLWRIVADTTQAASLNLPVWTKRLLENGVMQGRVQLAANMPMRARLWGAVATIQELYLLVTGTHTSYGVAKCPGTNRNYLAELARIINNLD